MPSAWTRFKDMVRLEETEAMRQSDAEGKKLWINKDLAPNPPETRCAPSESPAPLPSRRLCDPPPSRPSPDAAAAPSYRHWVGMSYFLFQFSISL